MNESLLKLYCKYHPEFLESLEIFSECNKNRLLKNLKTQNTKSNFLSIVSEIQFGELFTKLNFEIEYEKKYKNQQTPDWSLFSKKTTTICEVYRLDKSKKVQEYTDFENEIKEALRKLEYNYLIEINLVKNDFDIASFNTAVIINQVKNWLISSAKVKGDKIIVNSNFAFEIKNINTKVNHLCFIGPAMRIDYKPHKLAQEKHLSENEITKKLKKYKEIILDENLAFIICISIDFVSGFEISECVQYFLGKEINYIDYGNPLFENYESENWGSWWTELGEFYSNPQLSGILILYNNSFTFLINPNRSQRIYDKEYNLLKEKLLSIKSTKLKDLST